MTFRHWLRGAAALALVAGLCGSAAAQSKLQLTPDESSRWTDIRNGVKPFVKENKADEAKKNKEAIQRKAQVEVARMLDWYNTAAGSSADKPISQVVRGLNDVIIEPARFTAREKLTEGQRDMIIIFGEEMVNQLKPLIGTADKPSGADMVVKINAARALSIVAKSGYEGVAPYATEILNDPKQHDAVKVYVLQALHNLFAVPNREREERSVLAKDEDEVAPIQALISFIARKPNYGADASEEEINAFRYLRREAVAALGKVRKPIVRTDGKVVAVPAVWLLRVANADVNFSPPVSISERIEALAGYLNMQGDKEQNMDFAAGFVALAIKDLAQQFKEARTLERPKTDDKEKEKKVPDNSEERDRQAWKLASVRISVGLKVWRDNWENLPGARPATVKKMLVDLGNVADKSILDLMYQGRRGEVSMEQLNSWLSGQQFTSRSLTNEDPSSIVTRSDANR